MRVPAWCVAVLGVALLAAHPAQAFAADPPKPLHPLERAYQNKSTAELSAYFATIPRFAPRLPATARQQMPPLLQKALELYDQFYTREGMARAIKLKPGDEYLKAEYWLCGGELTVSVVDDTGRAAAEPFPQEAIYSVTLHGVDPGATLGKKVLIQNPYLEQDLEEFLGAAPKGDAGGGDLRLSPQARELALRRAFLAPVLAVTAAPFSGQPMLFSLPDVSRIVFNQRLDRAEVHVAQYGVGWIVRYALENGRWVYKFTKQDWIT